MAAAATRAENFMVEYLLVGAVFVDSGKIVLRKNKIHVMALGQNLGVALVVILRMT